MPIHNFRCEKCLFYWEEIWSFKEYDDKIKDYNDKIKECPNCKDKKIIKFINPVGIKFKGKAGNSGFYTLDYALVDKKDKERNE